MQLDLNLEKLALDYRYQRIGKALLLHADCFSWLSEIPENSLHAVVTDPPYGVKEFDLDQLAKMRSGKGGVWRIPPSFDGAKRAPLPRFTALNGKERLRLEAFFEEWARLLERALCPGAHVFIACNTFLSQLVFGALAKGGLEFRGMLIREVRTLRGGDRPKNAEAEFAEVCSLPRGCFEPWGLLRKAMPKGMKVSDCLREYGTGGLRRLADGGPFEDLIRSERTPKRERQIAGHPSLKPQSFLRQIVRAALPLGKGVICDPFMGSGSTLAAADALGLHAIGTERVHSYFELACDAVPKLSAL